MSCAVDKVAYKCFRVVHCLRFATIENGVALERIHNCIYSIITFELIGAIAYSVS
jgi:hypothetical protein